MAVAAAQRCRKNYRQGGPKGDPGGEGRVDARGCQGPDLYRNHDEAAAYAEQAAGKTYEDARCQQHQNVNELWFEDRGHQYQNLMPITMNQPFGRSIHLEILIRLLI